MGEGDPLDIVRVQNHAQAVETAMRFLGPRGSVTAKAIADLVVHRLNRVDDACADVLFMDFASAEQETEMRARLQALVTECQISVAQGILEAVAITARGNALR